MAKTKTNGKLVHAMEDATSDREQFTSLPTGNSGKLIDQIPDFISVRVTWKSTAMEQAAAVWLAFELGKLADCPDPRLRVLAKTPQDLRNQSARRIDTPCAALVRSPNSRLVTLAVQVPEHMQSDRPGNWRAVAAYTTEADGRLPEEPRCANYELPTEALARIIQMFGKLTDREAMDLFKPISEDKLLQTHVEQVELEAVLYRTPHGASGVMWVRDHKGWLWSCGLVRGAALRPVAEEPWPDPVELHRERMNRQTSDPRTERLAQTKPRLLPTKKAERII